MKVAICTIAKLENHYIREWVEYHLNLGFNKIFLYDNNDPLGERFEDEIDDYIQTDQVHLIDFRGHKWGQIAAFNDCYTRYGNEYDWIAFIDVDEFITLTKDTTIQDFLARPQFNNFDGVYLKWVYYTDNNLITVKDNNYNCLTRFTEADARSHIWALLEYGKRISKTNLHIRINSSHGPTLQSNYIECYPSGEPVILDPANPSGDCEHNNLDGLADLAYVKHFNTKSLQEFLEYKFTRCYPIPYRRGGLDLDLNDYFKTCKITKEKLNYIQHWLDHYRGPKDIIKLQQQLNAYREELK